MTATARHLPPKNPMALPVAGAMLVSDQTIAMAKRRARYGPALSWRVPGVGAIVSVADPALFKEIFTAPADVIHGGDNNLLAKTLGPNSPFGLDEDRHLRARRVMLPPFRGDRMMAYTDIVEEETLREISTWKTDTDFASLPSMMRITLDVILRAVFGARGPVLDELRRIIPPGVKLGQFLTAAVPLQRDLGPGSPWRRFVAYREVFAGIVDRIIAEGRADPQALEDRTDVMALMLRARYDDGEPMSREEITDQLLSMLVAGHETTAGTLAWAVERLRRHPDVLRDLTTEAHEGGNELREATIREIQRTRPVISGTIRQVNKPLELGGQWLLPRGTALQIEGLAVHMNPEIYPDPERFDPQRFVGVTPDTYAWLPYGGGRRRCIGAAFAHMEMDIVLKTLLTHCAFVATSQPGERYRFKGVAFQPHRGGVARLRALRPINADIAPAPLTEVHA